MSLLERQLNDEINIILDENVIVMKAFEATDTIYFVSFPTQQEYWEAFLGLNCTLSHGA
jgi:hypothetical protein